MHTRRRLATALLLGCALWLCCGRALASQCVACHTTPAKLVPAVRELRAASAHLPSSAELTAGEG